MSWPVWEGWQHGREKGSVSEKSRELSKRNAKSRRRRAEESSLLRGHPELMDRNPGSEPQPGQSGRVPRHGKANLCRSNGRDGARGPQATLVSSGGHRVLMPRNLSPPSGAPPSQFRRPRHRKVAMSQTGSHISNAKCPQNLATAILMRGIACPMLNDEEEPPWSQQSGKYLVPITTRLSKDRKQKYGVFLSNTRIFSLPSATLISCFLQHLRSLVMLKIPEFFRCLRTHQELV